jgi:hypothetical protein
MIALLMLVAASKAVLYDTLDPDCFWHLRVAEQLEHDGIGPLVDHISYASIKTPWTPYSWLAELGMKAIWDIGGYRLAVLAQAMLMVSFVLLIALSALQLQREENPTATILATTFAMYFSLPYLSFRPVTFALVLLALCTWLLLRDRRLHEQSRAIWLVIPTTVLMTNCHFFSFLVPTWIGCLLIGAMIEGRGIFRYFILIVSTTLACLATPMLPGMLRAMWDYQTSDPMLGAGVIAEFQPVWSGPLGALSVALLVGWLACLYVNQHHLRWGEIFWSLLALLLLLRLGRFAPVFAPIAAATLAARMNIFGASDVINRAPIRLAIICILVAGTIRIALDFPGSDMPLDAWLNRQGPDTPGYPTAAADFLASHIPPGRIINELSWGGYLAWRLGDNYPILLDGRTQLYTPHFWRATYAGRGDESRDLLGQTGAAAALLPAQRSRFHDALMDLGWKRVYADDRAQVLIPPDPSQSVGSAE